MKIDSCGQRQNDSPMAADFSDGKNVHSALSESSEGEIDDVCTL